MSVSDDNVINNHLSEKVCESPTKKSLCDNHDDISEFENTHQLCDETCGCSTVNNQNSEKKSLSERRNVKFKIKMPFANENCYSGTDDHSIVSKPKKQKQQSNDNCMQEKKSVNDIMKYLLQKYTECESMLEFETWFYQPEQIGYYSALPKFLKYLEQRNKITAINKLNEKYVELERNIVALLHWVSQKEQRALHPYVEAFKEKVIYNDDVRHFT